MSRDPRVIAGRYGHREKLSSRGVVPDLLTNLPSPVKRRGSLSSTKKKTEKKEKEKNATSAAAPVENVDKGPTTAEILEKAQETDPRCVFEIDLRDRGLKEIPNLRQFLKTRILDLSSNKIERITYLFNTKDLRELKLYDNSIRCIEGLDDLKELNILQLQHNEISSIGASLQALKKLKQLRLDSNRIRSVTTKELCSCAQITSLDLSFNRLENIDAVVCLPNLDELFASHNKIKTLPALNRCKKLTELRLNDNAVADAGGLKGASGLRTLDLANNHLLGLKPTGVLSKLEYLNVSGNHLEEVDCFDANFPELDVLDLRRNRLQDAKACIASLARLPNLCELLISSNPCSAALSSLSSQLPGLELLDGASLRRPSSASKSSAPVMRPMSASTVISAKFVENQISAMKEIMAPFEAKLNACYSSLRESIDQLPPEAPNLARSEGEEDQDQPTRPSSRSGRRSRIREAQDFARSMNFEP